MIGIYKITNPKGKTYIGQSINIDRRWSEYNKMKKEAIGTKLYNSLKKYGPENHKFEIVEECNIEHLDEKETYWTLQTDSLYPNGLVLKIGGTYGYMTEESKNKMKKPKHTTESKEKISKANKGKTKSDSFKSNLSKIKKGIKLSKSTCDKISKAKKGKPKHSEFGNKFKKSILQYDTSGNFIKSFPSIKEAASELKISSCSIIYCCQGKKKSIGNYTFKYTPCLD